MRGTGSRDDPAVAHEAGRSDQDQYYKDQDRFDEVLFGSQWILNTESAVNTQRQADSQNRESESQIPDRQCRLKNENENAAAYDQSDMTQPLIRDQPKQDQNPSLRDGVTD